MREKRKVFRNLNGIRSMNRIPGAMVVIDPRTEMKAVAEAKKMGVPVIGIIDTDGDPDVCDLIIPANDDAIRSVAMIMSYLADGILAGKEIRAEKGVADPQAAGSDAQPVGKGAPVPRPRAAKAGGRRRPSRQDLAAANQQVEIKSIAKEDAAAAAAAAAPAVEVATPEKSED
jgi:small subunit ribosomal protein S2